LGRAALLIARSPRQSASVTWIAPPIPALCFRKRGWTMNRKLGALYGVATAVLLATQPPLSSPAAKAMSPIKFVFLTQVALLISVPLLLSRTRPFPRDRLQSSRSTALPHGRKGKRCVFSTQFGNHYSMSLGFIRPAQAFVNRYGAKVGGMERRQSQSLAPSEAERNCTMAILARFLNNEDGATAIEYALIASLIALFIIVGVQTVGTSVSTVFTEVGAALK
jgi:pilus assembly protein Flp/PilA